MTTTADVLVVGAGIIGSSIAYQLARRGVDVIAVDKGIGPAEGSTGASSSICRCRYTHPAVVRLAFHGQEAFSNWSEFTGLKDTRSDLRRVGVIWLMGETTEKVEEDTGSVVAEDEEEIVENPDMFKKVPDADFIQMKLAAFHQRIPSLEPRGRVTGIAGLYTINREDVHPIVGPTGIDGFWVANGFSGHGFELAPAIGSMIAQAVSGEKTAFDTGIPMSFFAVDRDPIDVDVKSVLA